MTPFQAGAMEGFWYVVSVVLCVSLGFAMCFGSIGGLVLVWRWMGAILRGGCP